MSQFNARFWEQINGSLVKLTIPIGGDIVHYSGGPTEEGFHWTHNHWSFDKGYVVRDSYSNSSDCDGRLEHWNLVRAHLSDKRQYDWLDQPTLNYQKVSASQRDHSAEAAGY